MDFLIDSIKQYCQDTAEHIYWDVLGYFLQTIVLLNETEWPTAILSE